jgi:phenylacetate-CoA ligase
VLRRAAYMAQMLQNEWQAPAILIDRQTRRLRALVRHAASRVPFYRDLYAAHGVRAASFEGLNDLRSLPIVDKHLLRAAGAAAVSLDAPAEQVLIRTSGSTGEPFEFPIDPRYDQWRKAQCLRPYLSNGQRLRDKVLRLTARPTLRTPWFSRFGLLREWRADSVSEPALVVEAWRKFGADVLQGYPSSLRSLAHHCLDRREPLVPPPRLVFTDSELMLADTRGLIEQAFGTSPIDIFGTFETDNIAYQCSARAGYHVATDCVVLEIVRDGKPVPCGEEGEIVVTVLENRRTPFIRYNLRDIGRLSTEGCSCARSFPLLALLGGRANDLITFADGTRRSPLGILARMTPFANVIRQFQLRQITIGRFELFVVPASRYSNAAQEQILNSMQVALVGAEVQLRLVDVVPQDKSGKRRCFVSQLATGHGP